MDTRKAVITALALAALSAAMAGAQEYKYRNPQTKIRPVSREVELAQAAARLGSPPALDEKERARVEGGGILVREILGAGAGGGRRFEAIAVVAAPPGAVMACLRDFGSFVGTMPNVKKIEFTWEGNVAHVTQWLKIALSTIVYELNIAHYGDSLIEWEFVAGDIKDTTGYYRLFPRAGGKETLLHYHVYSEPGMAVPQFILDLSTKSSMPGVIEAIRKSVAKGSGK